MSIYKISNQSGAGFNQTIIERFNAITYAYSKERSIRIVKGFTRIQKNQVNPVILSNKYLSSYKICFQGNKKPGAISPGFIRLNAKSLLSLRN